MANEYERGISVDKRWSLGPYEASFDLILQPPTDAFDLTEFDPWDDFSTTLVIDDDSITSDLSTEVVGTDKTDETAGNTYDNLLITSTKRLKITGDIEFTVRADDDDYSRLAFGVKNDFGESTNVFGFRLEKTDSQHLVQFDFYTEYDQVVVPDVELIKSFVIYIAEDSTFEATLYDDVGGVIATSTEPTVEGWKYEPMVEDYYLAFEHYNISPKIGRVYNVVLQYVDV